MLTFFNLCNKCTVLDGDSCDTVQYTVNGKRYANASRIVSCVCVWLVARPVLYIKGSDSLGRTVGKQYSCARPTYEIIAQMPKISPPVQSFRFFWESPSRRIDCIAIRGGSAGRTFCDALSLTYGIRIRNRIAYICHIHIQYDNDS